jgi:hypothetical protein
VHTFWFDYKLENKNILYLTYEEAIKLILKDFDIEISKEGFGTYLGERKLICSEEYFYDRFVRYLRSITYSNNNDIVSVYLSDNTPVFNDIKPYINYMLYTYTTPI